MLIGSSDGNGNADVTPKGDRPGFAAILDDNTIAIPDRPGNNRLDTLENIARQPGRRPALPDPRHERDAARQRRGEDHRRSLPCANGWRSTASRRISVIVVTVKAAYMHCAKAFMRSELWKPESWPDRASMPTLGEILRDQLALDQSAAETDRWLDEAYKQTLW